MINDAHPPAPGAHLDGWLITFDELKDEHWLYCVTCDEIYIDCDQCWVSLCNCDPNRCEKCKPLSQLIAEIVKVGPPNWYNNKRVDLENSYWEARDNWEDPEPEPEPTVLDLIIEECDREGAE